MKKLFPLLLLLAIAGCSSRETTTEEKDESQTDEVLQTEEETKQLEKITISLKREKLPFVIPSGTKVLSVKGNDKEKKVEVSLSKDFSYVPFREDNIDDVYNAVKSLIPSEYKNYQLTIKTLGQPIEELIPNFYRENISADKSRIPNTALRPEPIVKNISKPFVPVEGLFGRNIALWPSHGWYYSHEKERWEWQRARLFQTVEDLIPFSFCVPYLIPMLENAGANVFMPRERDTQRNEIVIDNDTPQNHLKGKFIEINELKNIQWKSGGTGFAYGNPPYGENHNPFLKGSYRKIAAETEASAYTEWIPMIDEEGYYSVYISYGMSDENVTDAEYIVHHAGGETKFNVNQQIGGGTWIYLGNFKFSKGSEGKVVLSNKSKDEGKFVTADAVRFGGGMGLVERGGSSSGRPKFSEGSRYWLQYAGMPDTLIYDLSPDTNDYNDDFRSRGEYVNYLAGAPFGPNKKRDVEGLKIPIDASIAFHTDAGITSNDTSVGTLMIYSIEDVDKKLFFPDGTSRLANRDFGDIVQTQIVDDLRAKYDIAWSRRDLREAQYSEAARPNVPSILLELLSHQNFLDMKFVHDPNFRFDVSRSIYKGVLKFISAHNGFDYTVQPLPPDNFSIEVLSSDKIRLKWQPVKDELEPTADAENFIVYKRIEEGGFDNGTYVKSNSLDVEIEKGKIFSFKVSAVNKGGESFPTEILSAYLSGKSEKPFLIVNGFDRVAGPHAADADNFKGFLNQLDAGVPDKYDLSFTGIQYDFDPSSQFVTNDAPGHGASQANYETEIIAGNSFDFPYLHGKSFKSLGYSFVSSSDEAVMNGLIDLKNYSFVDLILGEEKETKRQKRYEDSLYGRNYKAFPKILQNKIKDYLANKGNLFVSGSYVGSDLSKNEPDIKFAKDVLKIDWKTGHASQTGKVESVSKNFSALNFSFNTELNDSIYQVEAPDEVDPINGSQVLLRYSENRFSAAAGYKKDYGVVVFGFPFETILNQDDRNLVLKRVIDFLKP